MFDAKIKIRKEYVNFTDNAGKTVEMQGIRVILGPKIEKFFTLENISFGSNSNYELLGYTNPNLCQWYSNVPVGTEMVLTELVDHQNSNNLDELGYKHNN